MTTHRRKNLRLSLALLFMPWLLTASWATSVSVSSPASGSTVSSSFTINAKASSTRQITAWYIYSDSKAVWHTTSDVASISASLSLSSGKHKVLVRAWDSSGAYGTATLYLTVGTSGTSSTTGVPTPPSYAKVISGIENKSGWGHCSDCAANPADPTPPLASWVFQQFQSTPSMDGSATKMKITGTQAYADVLHWVKFGAQNAYKNFIWEFYVNGDQASLNAQNLEFDLFQAVNGKKFMFGTQCNYKKGIWQGWNYINKWVDFPTVPCKKFAPGKWTRVVWYLQRTWDNKMRYISLTVGSTTYKINSYQPVGGTSWGDTFGVQFQQDMDKYATDYTIWVDKVKVSMW